MTTSPDEIGKLKELERLEVRMETGHWTSVITSSLQFVWWDCWSEVTYVIRDRAVYLSGRELSIVPEAVSDLTELEELDLPDNYQQELPTSINKLKNLKRLTSEVNQLRELPQAIAELSNLTVLSVRNKQLSVLPSNIKHLKNLRRLYLSSNSWLHCLMRLVNWRSWNGWMRDWRLLK